MCIDSFTSFLLFSPIRIIVYLLRLVRGEHDICHFRRIFDLLMFSIVVIITFIISQIDIGVVYHYVRAESVIKLYAFYNALGVC